MSQRQRTYDLNEKRVSLRQMEIHNDLKTIDEIESGGDGISEIKKNVFEFKMNL